MNRVVHFEIQADDLPPAAKFYSDVFGWKIEKYEGLDWDYWMIMTAEADSKELGINGGMFKRPVPLSQAVCGANAFVCTMVVDDYDGMAKRIESAGGKVAMPKFAIPGMAWQGYFLDTEGNNFGIHQADENAR